MTAGVRGARAWLVALIGATGVVLGCSAATDPNAVAALDFTGIAWPAVVTGDSLRDSAGTARPLTATVYDGEGDVIVGAPVTFFSLDTGVTIHPSGHLVATRRDGTVRLVATIAGLQSMQRLVRVTRLPDTAIIGTAVDTFAFAVPDKNTNVSALMSFTLRSSDTTGGVSPNVAGWAVRWRVLHDGDTLATTDTTLVSLWDGSGSRHSLRDTTGIDGVSSRKLRIFANQLAAQPDSFIVVAEVRALGAHVPGSPLRFVLHVTPPGP